MERLNYDVLKKSGYDRYVLKDAPEKVLQFGEGNFLRAFVDYWFDLANEKAGWNGKCCLVQPIAPGLAKMINEQEGLYTLYLRGSEKGEKVDLKRVISSVSRCINPYDDFDFTVGAKLAFQRLTGSEPAETDTDSFEENAKPMAKAFRASVGALIEERFTRTEAIGIVLKMVATQ